MSRLAHSYLTGEQLMVKKVKKVATFDISKHVLVPKHDKVSEKEKKELFSSYNITLFELPKILITDPAIRSLNVKIGDVIKITKKSQTAGEVVYYRGVVSA